MIKLKTRKSAFKRVKIKKNALVRKKAYKAHLLRKKNSKRLRNLSRATTINKHDILSFSLMLHL